MNIGAMRQRVTVQGWIDTKDSLGQPIRTFNNIVTLYAQIEVQDNSQEVLDRGVARKTRIELRMRPSSRVVTQGRVVWRGEAYDIVSVIDVDGRNREFIVVAERTTNV